MAMLNNQIVNLMIQNNLKHHFCAVWFMFIHFHPCFLFTKLHLGIWDLQMIGRVFFSEELYKTLEADNVDLSMATRPWIDRMTDSICQQNWKYRKCHVILLNGTNEREIQWDMILH